MATTKTSHQDKAVDLHETKFDELTESVLNGLQHDKQLLANGDAPKFMRDFYEGVFNGDTTKMVGSMRDAATISFMEPILEDYIGLLKKKKLNIPKLAFHLTAERIWVWAEIKDDDESTLDELILTEAEVNSRHYAKTGIYIDSMIVEECDKVAMPDNYQAFVIK